MKNLFILFSILLSLCIGLSNGAALIGASKLTISNQLQHNKLLKVHCHSSDDGDLGEKILKIGEEYEFKFDDNFRQSTKISCQMDQGPNFKHHKDFVAYETSWSKSLEAKCLWDAKEEGIFFGLDGQPPAIKYLWDHPAFLKN